MIVHWGGTLIGISLSLLTLILKNKTIEIEQGV